MLDWLNTDVATPIWVSAAYKMDSIEGKVSHVEFIFVVVVLLRTVGSTPLKITLMDNSLSSPSLPA